MQAARVGEVDDPVPPALIGRVGLELAQVVQQRPRDRHVAVDLEQADRRGCADRLRHPEAVLQQPVGVRLVVVLRGGRRPVAGPQLRALPQHALQQHAQVGLLDRADELTQVALHLARLARRPVEQVARGEAPLLRGGELAQVDLWPEAGVHGVAPAHVHRLSRSRQRLGLLQALPHHRGHRSRAVAQQQAQVVSAVAARTALELTHEQHLVDLLAVCQLVDEHVSEGRALCGRHARAVARRCCGRDGASILMGPLRGPAAFAVRTRAECRGPLLSHESLPAVIGDAEPQVCQDVQLWSTSSAAVYLEVSRGQVYRSSV